MIAHRSVPAQPSVSPEQLRVFLGGHDLEMITIAELVRETLGPDAVVDRRLPWSRARASAYADAIAATAAAGLVPVLVELAPDMPLPETAVVVDHHGPTADRPSALAQMFALLRCLPNRWSRRLALVDANDVGHVAGLRAAGATTEEIAAIRAADRRAQGITRIEERQGLTALAAARRCLGGRLLIVALPHRRTATVTDPLALARPVPLTRSRAREENLLVLMPGEVAFFGAGAGVAALARAFSGGFSGGALPARGFWGRAARTGRLEAAVLAVLDRALPRTGSPWTGSIATTRRAYSTNADWTLATGDVDIRPPVAPIERQSRVDRSRSRSTNARSDRQFLRPFH